MREVEVSRLTDVIEKLCIEANEHLPEDVKCTIKSCGACEDGEIAKGVLDNLSVFACAACFDGAFYVFRKMFICFDTEFFDDICKSAYFYFTHSGKLPSLFLDMPLRNDIFPFSLYQRFPVTAISRHRYRNIFIVYWLQ